MINKKRLGLFIFALSLLALFSNLNAQTQGFVQSRYMGNPDSAITCPINECQVEDGVLHFHLAQEEPFTDNGIDKIRLEVQTRASLKDLRYLSGEVYIAYSTDAFGENLASRCTITDEDKGIFADKDNFSLSVDDESQGLMKISTTAAATTDTVDIRVDQQDYQSYATLECEIADKSFDAGLALHWRTYDANTIVNSSSETKAVFALADNDLRGYRLDGKFWVQDYMPFSDGRGVRLQFSGDLDLLGVPVPQVIDLGGTTVAIVVNLPEITTANFVLSNTTASIASVSHFQPEITLDQRLGGDLERTSYVNVEFSDRVDNGILTLVNPSNDARTLRNSNGDAVELADGSFMAALNYDDEAPKVSSISYDEGDDTFLIDFDREIIPSSLNTEDICITIANFEPDVRLPCIDSSQISVEAINSSATQQLVLVANTTDILVYMENFVNPSPTFINREFLTIEFARNAVLGADLRVVEDYQVESKENPVVIDIAQTVGSRIQLTARYATGTYLEDTEPSNQPANRYDIRFTVSADGPAVDLDSPSSYQLVLVRKNGTYTPFEPSSSPRLIDTTVEDNTTTAAVFLYTVDVEPENLQQAIGFSLVRATDDALVLNGLPPYKRIQVFRVPQDELIAVGDLIDEREDSIARFSRIECSGYVPYINRELFLRVVDLEALGRNARITEDLTINDMLLSTGTITQSRSFDTCDTATSSRSTCSGTITLLEPRFDEPFFSLSAMIKVEFDDVIKDDSIPIRVRYGADSNIVCEPSASLNSDQDDVPDAVDPSPYNKRVEGNPMLDPAPTTTSVYYSRNTLVRSIITGGEFTRVSGGDANRPTSQTRVQRSIGGHEYFGIVDEDARAFRIDPGPCSQSLEIATRYKIDDYKITEACTEVTNRLGSEPPSNTTITYAWGLVDSNGILTSDVVEFHVRVVPEVNFTGQSSYLYSQVTTVTNIATDINVSAYIGDGIDVPENIFYNKLLETGGRLLPQETFLTSPTIINGVASYDIPLSILTSGEDTNEVLRPGETLVVWLGSRNGDDLYELPSEPEEGGAISLPIGYLVGPNNVINIKQMEDNDQFVRMRNIYLFEYRDTTPIEVEPVITVSVGRTYYIVASYLTDNNTTNPEIVMRPPPEGAGYEIVELSTTTTNTLIAEASEFDRTIFGINQLGNIFYDLIPFEVTTSTDGPRSTVTLGWDKIGNIEDVTATYRVTTDSHVIRADIDGDRISDEIESPFVIEPGVNTSLFVDVRSSTDTIHVLTTGNGDNYVYVSDAGLILATGGGRRGDRLSDYSPANIAYSSIDSTTQELLGYDDGSMGESSIETIATFAARSIPYSIATMPTAGGGLIYTVFPMESSLQGETLYLSRYNNSFGGWQNFERNTEDRDAETWYAIDWTIDQPCPTNVELYKYEHKFATTQTFVASDYNCIMVVTKDGGPYDNAIDGSVSEQIAVGRQPFVVEESMQCAAFYPNIGQTELFFRIVTGNSDVDPSGLTLMQDGMDLNPIMVSEPKLIRETSPLLVGHVFMLKATLQNAITTDSTIRATYTQGDNSMQCTSMVSLDANADGDTITLSNGRVVGLPDIADNAPFDRTDSSLNPSLASIGPLETILTTRYPRYFSRDTLVRSLLRGDAFSAFSYVYIDEESDRLVRADFTSENAMSETEYFGVSDDAIVLKVLGEMCEPVLKAIEDNNLTKVQIREFCKTDVTGKLVDEPAGSNDRYVWVKLNSDNTLVSRSDIYTVRVLPEFNFETRQASYLYAVPTTKTVGISREPSPGTQSNDVQLRQGTAQPESIRLGDDGTVMYDALSGAIGTTVTYWLSGSSSVWAPSGDALEPRPGGHPSISPSNC